VKIPQLPRWLAPVLVVAFLLLTAWAGYNVSRAVAASQAPGPGGPTVEYGGSGSYGYVASMVPNTLFNSTTVSGDNVTLFVAITNWVNVSFADTVALGPAAAAALNDQFAVSLSTSAWSRALVATDHDNASANTTNLTVTDRYDLNVSRIEGLTSSIDAQLNYSATAFTVSFVASVTGSVAVGLRAAPVVLDSWLNLTFRGPLIVPSGAPATVHGSVTGADGPSSPGVGGALAVAWLELAASAAALLFSVWLFWSARRAAGPAPLPDLDRLIEPYEEVIARTTKVPDGVKVLPVDRWEDLVKVADTLGRPILRPLLSPDDLQGTDFYVFDGTLAYLYRHPRPDEGGPSAAGAGAATAQAGPKPAAPPPAAAPPPGPARPPPTAGRPPGAPPSAAAKRLTAQLEKELRRIRTLPLDAVQRWYLFSLATVAVRTVASGDLQEAQRNVDELRRAIDRSLDLPRRPS